MIVASQLAGFLAAHAIESIAAGVRPVPMLGFTDAEGQRQLQKFAGHVGESIEHARVQLTTNAMDANDAVLLYDGRIQQGQTALRALVLELRCYAWPGAEVVLAVPYTRTAAAASLRVHSPKLLVWSGCEDFEMGAVLQAFFDGVQSHASGYAVWSAALDESI
jgi:hypothetical protein